jgi:hypothetical protein
MADATDDEKIAWCLIMSKRLFPKHVRKHIGVTVSDFVKDVWIRIHEPQEPLPFVEEPSDESSSDELSHPKIQEPVIMVVPEPVVEAKRVTRKRVVKKKAI